MKTILREMIVICFLPLPLFAAGHLHCWARNESFGCLLEMARKMRHSPQIRWLNERIHNAPPSINRKIITPRSHKGNYRYNATQEKTCFFMINNNLRLEVLKKLTIRNIRISWITKQALKTTRRHRVIIKKPQKSNRTSKLN